MFFLGLSAFAVAAMVFALGDGAAGASNGCLAVVWIAEVVARHSFGSERRSPAAQQGQLGLALPSRGRRIWRYCSGCHNRPLRH